jgi:hypothetical protein
MGLRMVGGKVVDDDLIPPVVTFYEHVRRVGMTKYINVDYIKIKAPGVRDFMSRAATAKHKAEYSEEWDKYQCGQQVDGVEGETPLTVLPAFKVAFAMDLKQRGITCIETLAASIEPEQDYLLPMWKQAKKWALLSEAENEEGQV